ncbi:hypothetical protein ACIHDR_48230 [Nocardia sp. NPDC052278]|uniref:hypothetical protein n=1 Tax=unclassified Nocardia TaxID=2637762 RepID=UPI0036A4ABB0
MMPEFTVDKDLPEFTFDLYTLTTITVRASDFDAAQRILPTLEHIEMPDSLDPIADNVTLVGLEYRGVANAFSGEPLELDTESPETRYSDGGFAQLERLAMSSPLLPLMFRVVQRSPEGANMQPITPGKLDEVIDQVIRVGLAGEVCTVDGIYAPLVGVDDDGTVRIEQEGWEPWQPVTSVSSDGAQLGPIISSTVPLGDELAEQILRRPGLYVKAWTNLPDRSWLILHADDSQQVWEAHG